MKEKSIQFLLLLWDESPPFGANDFICVNHHISTPSWIINELSFPTRRHLFFFFFSFSPFSLDFHHRLPYVWTSSFRDGIRETNRQLQSILMIEFTYPRSGLFKKINILYGYSLSYPDDKPFSSFTDLNGNPVEHIQVHCGYGTCQTKKPVIFCIIDRTGYLSDVFPFFFCSRDGAQRITGSTYRTSWVYNSAVRIYL